MAKISIKSKVVGVAEETPEKRGHNIFNKKLILQKTIVLKKKGGENKWLWFLILSVSIF